MSALTEAANDELDDQLLAMTNIIDGLSLVIAKQQAVMRQALSKLESAQMCHPNAVQFLVEEAVTALRNSLEGKQ